ncbi:MAG: biotin/lipoyl-binding protein, partial [Pseudomonadota bacterium]
MPSTRVTLLVCAGLALAGVAVYLTVATDGDALPPGFARGNGRLEAEQVEIAPMIAGRVDRIHAEEGNLVEEGKALVEMDTDELEAVLERANRCFDFGAWAAGLAAASSKTYEVYVLMNASVRGPFLPSYERRPWWDVFADELGG